MLQQQFDFTHTRENNPESEMIYQAQKPRLSNNANILYQAFLRGEVLSGIVITGKYKMLEYRKRIQEIKKSKLIELEEKTLSNGAKQWWIKK